MAPYLILRTKGKEVGGRWAVVWLMLAERPDTLGPGTFHHGVALERDVVMRWEGVCNRPPLDHSQPGDLRSGGQLQ